MSSSRPADDDGVSGSGEPAPTTAKPSKRPRRQCALCLTCGRTGAQASEQSRDPDNFVPRTDGGCCSACGRALFDPVDRTAVEYGRWGDIKLTELCFDGRFDEALLRVRRYPREANTLGTGERTESALHWAAYGGAPPDLIRALVRAGPDLVTYSAYWHEQGTPLDLILRDRPYPGIEADTLDRVRAVLDGDPTGKSAQSLFTAYTRLGCPLLEAADDDKARPRRLPADLSFVPEEVPDEDLTDLGRRLREATTLTYREQCRMMLDAFVLVAKRGYYGRRGSDDVDDLDDQPLLHALVAFPHQLREDDLNWTFVPDRAVRLACRLRPEELSLADGDGNLPLHLAVAHRTPYRKKAEWELRMDSEYEVDVEYCMREYGGVYWLIAEMPVLHQHTDRQKDDYDDFNSSTIALLLKKHPKAAKTQNRDGDLPLHLAIKARKTLCIVEALVKANPRAVRARDGDGNTCLHLLAQQMPGSLNVKEIFAQHEDQVDEYYSWDGGVGMGYDLMSSDKSEILDLLVRKYPEACLIRNDDGLLPYQCFMWNEAQNHWENVLRFMNEEVATTADEGTGLYPFMEAAIGGDLDLTYRTLQTFPSIMEQWK